MLIAPFGLRFGKWPEVYRHNEPLAFAIQTVPPLPKPPKLKEGQLYSPAHMAYLSLQRLKAIEQRSPKLLDDIKLALMQRRKKHTSEAKLSEKVEKQLRLRAKALWKGLTHATPKLRPAEAQGVLKALQDNKMPTPKIKLFHELLAQAHWDKASSSFLS